VTSWTCELDSSIGVNKVAHKAVLPDGKIRKPIAALSDLGVTLIGPDMVEKPDKARYGFSDFSRHHVLLS
jgi:hypothetical protein